MDMQFLYSDRNTRVEGLKVRFCGMTGIGGLATCVVLEDYTRRYTETDALAQHEDGRPIGEHTKHVQHRFREGDTITVNAHRLQPIPDSAQ